ncbi:MAG: 23S rRNA pseudouridine1911/1915/1917 synthase [Planctomycetota bacterium]
MSQPQLEVLHCDNHVLVVRKPAGLPTVPDSSGDASLFDIAREWIEAEFNKKGRAFLGVVQRLDRPVSGAIAFARTSKAADRLTSALREKRFDKRYWALCEAPPAAGNEGMLEQWLWKDGERNRVIVSTEGRVGAKLAQTKWRVLAQTGACLLELEPLTGRSHQLRVALASLGRPLLGDLKYGASAALPDRSIALHARRLQFDHPTRDERIEVEARLPELDCWSKARSFERSGGAE